MNFPKRTHLLHADTVLHTTGRDHSIRIQRDGITDPETTALKGYICHICYNYYICYICCMLLNTMGRDHSV